MDIPINMPDSSEIDCLKLHKMAFVFNAVQSGWEVRKNKGSYIFTKKHEGKKEIFLDSYIRSFIESNSNINKIK